MTEKRIRPYDVLIALNRVADAWPAVVLKDGRTFSRASAHAVLMALHRHYNWTTFNIALPVGFGSHRARPARRLDIASEVYLHPKTVGSILDWLTEDQDVLITSRGHGWTGATVRRFNLERLGLAEPEVDAMSTFPSVEPEVSMAEPEVDIRSPFRPQNQGYIPGDTETPGVLSHQGTTLTSGAAEVAPAQNSEETVDADQVQRKAVEQLNRLLPESRRERVRVLNPSGDCQWSVEDNLVAIDFPRYDSSTKGYMWARSLLAELAGVIDQAFGMEVELRFKGKQQEPQR